MTDLRSAAADFLAQRRIAVAGVSRSGSEAANVIYRKLGDHDYRVFAVNPRADEVEGADACYADLGDIPGGVDAAVFAAPPSAAEEFVRRCAELGVERVWLHRSVGQGSVSEEAVRLGRELDIRIIAGACPMMFLEPDVPHRCMRWVLGALGKLPSGEEYRVPS